MGPLGIIPICPINPKWYIGMEWKLRCGWDQLGCLCHPKWYSGIQRNPIGHFLAILESGHHSKVRLRLVESHPADNTKVQLH